MLNHRAPDERRRPAGGWASAGLPAPGPHGGDGAALARALGLAPGDVLDLSASLNPVAPDPGPVLAAHLGSIGRYPDPGPATSALAACLGVPEGRVLLTNGGAEAIALVAAELEEGQVDDPDFSLYRRHLVRVGAGAPRWRSNPHSPSGVLAAPAERAGVWDEAFWPLATGTWTRGDAERGSVTLGSLTKLLACPGLRAGYVIGPDEDLITRLAGRQPRWSVNSLACDALPEMLAGVDLPAWSSSVADLRDRLCQVLAGCGLAPRAAAASWVLVEGPELRARLARRGILVRDCSSFGMAGTVRIAVPDREGLRRLAGALG
ncbi:MAG: aminotransferase class I/II-fold pyridoxal phosphate-dependent enzyme [Acidimicrobiales bacterium]